MRCAGRFVSWEPRLLASPPPECLEGTHGVEMSPKEWRNGVTLWARTLETNVRSLLAVEVPACQGEVCSPIVAHFFEVPWP